MNERNGLNALKAMHDVIEAEIEKELRDEPQIHSKSSVLLPFKDQIEKMIKNNIPTKRQREILNKAGIVISLVGYRQFLKKNIAGYQDFLDRNGWSKSKRRNSAKEIAEELESEPKNDSIREKRDMFAKLKTKGTINE